MSNVLLEAAATGRPLVTSFIPGCREAVDEGRTGFTCRPRDKYGLYEAMKKIAELSREERMEMGLAGRKLMEERFDKEVVVEDTMNAIFRV
jgi:galacturonosyltransferase